MDQANFLSGQLLIAMPGIGDPRFERSLVLICAHDQDHAMGLAVNQPLEGLTVPALLERLEVPVAAQTPADRVMVGGPVEQERGFVLHTDDCDLGEHSFRLPTGLALSTTREALDAIGAEQGRPRRAMLALGYAGWGAGQLEREIRQNVWLVCDADEALIFGQDHGRKWSKALAKLGVDPSLLTTTAGSA